MLTGTQMLHVPFFVMPASLPKSPSPQSVPAVCAPHLILMGGTVATERAAAKPEHQNDHLSSCPSLHKNPRKSKEPNQIRMDLKHKNTIS